MIIVNGFHLIHEEIDDQKEQSISNNHVTYQKPFKEKTFLQVISVFASNGETCVRIAALLDSRSDATLIRKSVASTSGARRSDAATSDKDKQIHLSTLPRTGFDAEVCSYLAFHS